MANVDRTFILLGRNVRARNERNNHLCLELGQRMVNMYTCGPSHSNSSLVDLQVQIARHPTS